MSCSITPDEQDFPWLVDGDASA